MLTWSQPANNRPQSCWLCKCRPTDKPRRPQTRTLSSVDKHRTKVGSLCIAKNAGHFMPGWRPCPRNVTEPALKRFFLCGERSQGTWVRSRNTDKVFTRQRFLKSACANAKNNTTAKVFLKCHHTFCHALP